ncbi:MAG TPA: hypothetical protein PK867_29395, partial [Pirellulales bacterium]|nr:hypothetical protein [Pirellulales bacterium]
MTFRADQPSVRCGRAAHEFSPVVCSILAFVDQENDASIFLAVAFEDGDLDLPTIEGPRQYR